MGQVGSIQSKKPMGHVSNVISVPCVLGHVGQVNFENPWGMGLVGQ